MIKAYIRQLGQRWLSKETRRRLLRITRRPPVNRVDFGQLRRLQPISRAWGGDRGQPIDRHYIDLFLAAQAQDIKGRVLEVGDNTYTLAFGGDRVTRSEIVHAVAGNPAADYVADFTHAPGLPSGTFDCVICTQTLQLIADLPAALSTLHRILKPGGVVLATMPGISRIYQDPEGRWPDHWRFTTHSAGWLFQRAFPAASVQVNAYGNVLAATAFLHGLATEELTPEELAYYDNAYPMLVTVRAQKPIEEA